MAEVVYEEKHCQYCGKINWDSETGGYNEDCLSTLNPDPKGKCDTNGQHDKFDEDNNYV